MKRVRMQFWVRIALGVAVFCLLGASARSQALPVISLRERLAGCGRRIFHSAGQREVALAIWRHFCGRPRGKNARTTNRHAEELDRYLSM